MIEQYIYSRSETRFTNARGQAVGLGFGFMALSPDMNPTLKEDVKPHCDTCPRIAVTDSQGVRLPVLRKVRLAKSGRIMLQSSAWIEEKGVRPFHVAHGYVIDPGEKNDLQVANWLSLPYRITDPNKVEGGILLDSLPQLKPEEQFMVLPLSWVMGQLGLDQEQFCQMLLACFDALSAHRQVLIAYDFSAPEAQKLQKQILFWMLSCLPYALRLDLGIDTLYTEYSAPRLIQVAFVDKTAVQATTRGVTIKVGDQMVQVGSNYLVIDGQIIHNEKAASVWYGKDCVYSRWLSEIVRAIWVQDAAQGLAIQNAMNTVYDGMQQQLNTVPAGNSLDPQLYSAICRMYLGYAPPALAAINERVQSGITSEEIRACNMTILRWMGADENNKAVQGILGNVVQQHRVPAGQEDMELLSMMLRDGKVNRAAWIMSAFMAADMDAAGRGEVLPALQRYEKLVPPEMYARLLETALFERPDPVVCENMRACGVDYSAAATARRRGKWCGEKLDRCRKVNEVPPLIEKELTGLKGLDERQRVLLADEMGRAVLETRLNTMAPSPGMEDVIRLLKAAEPYKGTPRWSVYAAMVCALARRCQIRKSEAGLDGLEALQRAFSPYAGDRTLCDCWQSLFEQQIKAINERNPVFVVDERLTGRIRAIGAGLPRSFSPNVQKIPDQMLNYAYRMLLEEPQPFMTGAWMRQELQGRPVRTEQEQMLRLLGEFACQSRQDVKLWKGMAEQAGFTTEMRISAQTVMARMFLAGTLTGVTGPFVVFFLRKLPDKRREVLLQAAAQGGVALICGMMNYLEKFERELEPEGITDLIYVLRTVSGDWELLDQAVRRDAGSLEIDERLIEYIDSWVKERVISPDEGGRAAAKVLQHYEDNGTDNRLKLSVRRMAAKLAKGS